MDWCAQQYFELKRQIGSKELTPSFDFIAFTGMLPECLFVIKQESLWGKNLPFAFIN